MDGAGTVDKAVDVLFHLLEAGEARGVSAIGEALGVPRSSVHRLLVSLAARGLVEKDPGGRYRLGFGLVALGSGVLATDPLVPIVQHCLDGVVADLAETAFFVGLRGGQLTVLAKAEGSGFLRAAPRVGSTVPLHATAVGRLFLAFDPAAPPLGEELLRYTDQTVRNDEELAARVAEVRRRGIAVSDGEWVRGLSVVAAPVRRRDAHGAGLHGAVAVATTAQRMEELGPALVSERALGASRAIEGRLEGRDMR